MNNVDFRFVFMPYCIEKQPAGGYVVLNRKYKPLGFVTDQFINYADYPVVATIKGLTPALAEKLSWNKSANTDKIYLYDDGTNPISSAKNMAAYLDKLALLATLKLNAE